MNRAAKAEKMKWFVGLRRTNTSPPAGQVMSRSLEDCLANVVNEHTFNQFLQSLFFDCVADFEDPVGTLSIGKTPVWQNRTVVEYLEALVACTVSLSPGAKADTQKADADNAWRRCARLLYDARIVTPQRPIAVAGA